MKNVILLLFLSYTTFSQVLVRETNSSISTSVGNSKVLAEIKKSYSRQMGASFKMLENTILNANDTTWTARINNMPFWQICYHVLWYTDFYFHANQATFKPQSFDIKGIKDIHDKPNAWLVEQQKHPISKSNMLAYLKFAKQKAFQFIQGIDGSYFTTPSPFEWHGFPMIDLVDYNLRHLQHHIAYLNIILRREQDIGSPWIMHGELSEKAEIPSDTTK